MGVLGGSEVDWGKGGGAGGDPGWGPTEQREDLQPLPEISEETVRTGRRGVRESGH